METILLYILFAIIFTPIVAVAIYAHNVGYTIFKKCLLIGFITTVTALILHAIMY